jgi:hypothetical protein
MNFRAEHGIRTPGKYHRDRAERVMTDLASKLGIKLSQRIFPEAES